MSHKRPSCKHCGDYPIDADSLCEDCAQNFPDNLVELIVDLIAAAESRGKSNRSDLSSRATTKVS